jgi:hypothetical protein
MELKKLTWKRINNPLNQWANELNRQFSKEELQMTNTYMKKWSASLAIKEIQIKIRLRFHFTPVRMAIIKRSHNRCYQRCGKKEHSYTVGGHVNYLTAMKINMYIPQKTKNRQI